MVFYKNLRVSSISSHIFYLQGFHFSHKYFLWQDFFRCTIIFDLVTLTLNYEVRSMKIFPFLLFSDGNGPLSVLELTR